MNEREGVLGYKYLTLDVRSINDKFELPKNHDGATRARTQRADIEVQHD